MIWTYGTMRNDTGHEWRSTALGAMKAPFILAARLDKAKRE